MNLCIDIGNTRTKWAVFSNHEIIADEVCDNMTYDLAKRICSDFSIQNSIVSSTSLDLNQEVTAYLQKVGFHLVLTAKTPIPIINAYGTPATLGKDRLAAAIGAYEAKENQGCLVIDAGTCITYELITKEGKYLGGNISPGLEMRLAAMHHFTERLPLVNKQRLDKNYGYTTETALRTGAQLGLLHEIEGFITQYIQQFGHLKIILTGGDAFFFAKQLKTKIFVASNLVLVGLNKILNYNVHISKP